MFQNMKMDLRMERNTENGHRGRCRLVFGFCGLRFMHQRYPIIFHRTSRFLIPKCFSLLLSRMLIGMIV